MWLSGDHVNTILMVKAMKWDGVCNWRGKENVGDDRSWREKGGSVDERMERIYKRIKYCDITII